MRAIRVHAPAKINWSLEVLGRRGDGYHEIDTVFQAVSLCDVLEIRLQPGGAGGHDCVIECDTPGIPADESNLVHSAWRRILDECGGAAGVRVKLTKRIPSGAGLGGGSSDAAAMLLGMNRLFDLRLGAAALAEMAAGIGSDVPFFIRGGAARARGRGERLEAIRTAGPARHLVIVHPDFASPTADAYRRLNMGPLPPKAEGKAAGVVRRALEAGAPVPVTARVNDFDRVLCASDPRYGAVKERMVSAGATNPVLTGSGSACFSVAENAEHARRAAMELRRHFGFAAAVRTRRAGIRIVVV